MLWRCHLFIEWWLQYLSLDLDGGHMNRTCTSVWILLHQIKEKPKRSLICCWSRVQGVWLVKDIIRVAIDELTWSDGLHSWRSIDLIQSWSQSYLCFNRNRLIWVTDWQVNLSTAETMIKGGALTIPMLLLQLLVNPSNKYSTIYQLLIYCWFVLIISADWAKESTITLLIDSELIVK